MNAIPQNTNILLSRTALSRPLKPLMWISATQLNRSVTPPVYLWTHNYTEDRRALSHKEPESASPKRPTVREHGAEKAATDETRDQPNRKANKRRGKNVSPTRERTRRIKSRDRAARGESITGHEGEGDTKREVLVSVNRNSPDPDRGGYPIEYREKHHTRAKNDSDGVQRSEALHRSFPMKQYSLNLPFWSAQQLNLNFPPEKSSPAVRRSMSTKIALSRPFNVDENLGDQEYGEWVPRKLRVELGRFSSEKPKFGYDKLNEGGIVSGIAPEPDEHPPPINKSPKNCWDVELDHSTPSAPISKYASTPKAFKSRKKVAFETAFHRHGGSVFSDVNFDDLSLRPRITTVSESLYPFPPPNFILAASPSVPHTQPTDTLVIGTGKPLSAEKLEKHITQLQKKIESEKKKRALSPVASQKNSSPRFGRSVPESIFDAVPVDDKIVVPNSSFENVHDRNVETEVPTDVSGSRKLAGLVEVRKEKSMPRSSTGMTRSAKASSEKELRKKIVIPGSSMVRPHSSPSAGKSSRRPRSTSSSKSRKKERRPSVPKTPEKCAISEEELVAKTIIIQRWTRMRLARRKYLEILRAVPIIQDFWRKYTSYMPAEFR